ncbi:bifunctional phosphopantothenoylcysteine decarboxylase/phosphopantothenate--cysteine ligase CoaBC [Candidatus Solincola sp.]|jgi:phosphopantothenoylcysteine decarboxylase/phosphopantothenate--cysteine ligase|nr:bifunctional phosphopantothenoylcysteine decarboxylase/phosphopantothenate--cysteine ligase CoaBC [Actinomycetota bacterium]MDI7251450.1 bifunctional phosphopantothenoylcysteine decarboxylase/phosphopantothenate--cysteine ligase CoaBC [Actinomycetota bacterium]
MTCIVFGVTGGIAAYKAVEVVRRLAERGLDVRVVMTEHATRLVGPDTFRAVSGNPVSLHLFDASGPAMEHISLARAADLVVVAPATANILAKMAQGLADDLLSTTLLATRAPVLVAPAMNREMYRHPATQDNLRKLRERGVHVVGPESGALACGEEGEGRMAEPPAIVEAVLRLLDMRGDLSGHRVLVTAGGTREPLDPVRFIGNRSSGKMGYALAETARELGAEVILVSGPTHLQAPPGVERIMVETAEEMRREVLSRSGGCSAVVMAAAVADFTPSRRSEEKIKRGGREGLIVELVPTPDILSELSDRRPPGQVLVGFAAETGDLLRKARKKMEEKGVDILVANDVSRPGSGFDSDLNQAVILFRDGREEELDLMPKRELALRIWEAVAGFLGTSGGQVPGPA